MAQSPQPPERRQLLQQAAAVATALWLPRSAWTQVRLQTDPFGLGVASGSPRHDGVVLWTRLIAPDTQAWGSGALTVRWELAHDAQFQRLVRTGQAQALPQLAHAVHVELQGLAPDRWYYYRFMFGDATSPVGRTRTFPAPGAVARRLRLAYASCQHWEHGYYSAYRHMQQEQLDAVMFLGDYIYEYTGSRQAVRRAPAVSAVRLDDYRALYALYKSDTDLQQMHAACPWLMTWDDHEVQNDYAGLHPGSLGPPVADFAARRAAAYQAYYEHMPLRASVLTQALQGLATGAELRLYAQVPFGDLALLHTLDTRQYRDVQVCTKEGQTGSSTVNPRRCAEWHAAQRRRLGAAQAQWLDQSLARSAARWNVLGQQTVFGQRDFHPGPGQTLGNDAWDGYASARTRLTDSLQRHAVRNPVVLGGDVHAHWVGQVLSDYARPDSTALGVEFCGTSISSHGRSNARIPELLAENPHFIYANGEARGYGVAEFTPRALTVQLRALDDVARQDSGLHTLAQFVVEAGRPVVQRD